jgi:osmotically-inducible protein OsmY
MKTDSEIQRDVMSELQWEARINAIQPTEIGVAVKNGVVSLSGLLDSYSKKIAAEKAVMRVGGVKAVANDINVKLWSGFKKSDPEIAEAILNAIKWSTSIPEDKVQVKVDDGWVTLEGEVAWSFQKASARRAIEDLRGVKGVSNNIKVISKIPTTSEVKEKVSHAIQRGATTDAGKIRVDVSGNRVTLAGTVRSYAEKKDAENAAWSAPGVEKVDNNIEVSYSEIYV